MGNAASRKASVIDTQKTPEKKSVAAIVDQSPDLDNAAIALDPKTPAIPQTPLTQTIASHLNRISSNDVNQNMNIKTPSYLLRKKILYDLGYTYPIKEDPRSPTQCIPRTPLTLADTVDAVNENETSSFQYNSTLEDSCRDFNTKLDDITMEEADAANQNVQTQNTPTIDNGHESKKSLCAQKTPDCDSENTPDFEHPAKNETNPKMESTNDGKELEVAPQATDGIAEQNDSMFSTPSMNKSHRTGRIPLSTINRRAVAGEVTPLTTKNTSGTFSVEKNRKDLSFNILDENRGSARKSKIPVYKKAILPE